MKTFVPALLVALAGVATAQLPDLPQCSLQCFLTALSSDGCSQLTDFKCHCQKSDQLLSSVTPCVQSACSAAEQAEVIKGVESTCASAGVTISVPAPTSAAASSAASSAAASASSAASSVVSSAASGAASVTSSYAASASSVVASSTPVPSSNGTVPSSPATPSTSEFPGAASRVGTAAGLVGAAAVAFFAL